MATAIQTNHLEIAARAWAGEKAREMAGIIVDDALNKTDATIPNLDLIAEAEEFVMRRLTAWLKNNILEFTRAYMSDVEERELQMEKIARDALNCTPTLTSKPEQLGSGPIPSKHVSESKG